MKIIGKNVDLCSVTIDDAKFILSLRLDPDLNQHLSPVKNNLNKQKQWLEKSIANKSEYYFIIKNKKHIPVGTIRIYDIKENIFCWGSWIIKPEHRKYASFESIILLLKFAFFDLSFKETNFDVRKNNKKALDFYLRLGATITNENDIDYFLNYKKGDFLEKYNHYQQVIDKTPAPK